MGVGRDLPRIAPRGGHRQATCQPHGVFGFRQRLGRFKAAAHPLHIGHGAAQRVGGQFQREVIPRFQQRYAVLGCGHPQALAHGAVGGLAEVAALGVLLVGAARRQRDLYVGQRRTNQHAGVGALGKVGQNQPLPVFGQCVGRAVCRQLYAAAPRTGFQQQVDLGVMAQRLIVADALHSGGQGFFVEDTALAESDVQPEAVL